jgi:hypothetical protein
LASSVEEQGFKERRQRKEKREVQREKGLPPERQV